MPIIAAHYYRMQTLDLIFDDIIWTRVLKVLSNLEEARSSAQPPPTFLDHH